MSEDWVVDSLVGFLQSPVWNSPVNDFIDDNCVVFDPGDEEKPAYSQIHNSYHTLVERLLGSFTAELGFTAEQLAQACVHSSTLGGSHQKQLEQVLAAESFVLFKSLMVQKNIDLELQALNLLKNQLGHAPDVYEPNSPQASAPPIEGNKERDDNLFQDALEQSRKEFETQKSLDEDEMEKLTALAMQESLRLYEASEKEKKSQAESKLSLKTAKETKKEPTSPLAQMSVSESKEHSHTKISSPQRNVHQEPLQSLSPKHPPPSTVTSSVSSSEAASMWLQSAKAEFGAAETIKQKVAVQVPADLKSREAYLKRQRDHLLNIKRKARAKELDTYNATKAAPNKSSGVTSQPPKIISREEKKKAPEKDTIVGSTGSEAKSVSKGFNTGVLCSVIAGKLKEQDV